MSQDTNVQFKRNGQAPDPEGVAVAKRRQFSLAYKLRILQEADGCQEPGQLGALLRREGLYSSHLTKWRQQRADGQRQGLTSQPRGRKAEAQATEVAQLRGENERLHQKLHQAELILEAQKKLSDLLGLSVSERAEPK